MRLSSLLLCLLIVQCVSAATYTTKAGATSPLDWDLGSSWVGGVVPNVVDWQSDVIEINHDITKTGDFVITGHDFVTAADVIFRINGTLTVKSSQGNCSFTSATSSLWVIKDDLVLENSVPFNTGFGTVKVKGDFSNGSGGSSVTINGYLDIVGDITITTGTSVNGTGKLTWGTGGIVSSGSIGSCYSAGDVFPDNSGVDVSTCDVFLPVEFMNVSAKCSFGGTVVSWATATEKDNSYFIIEESIDLEVYTEIGLVEGAGNSSQRLDYTFSSEQLNEKLVSYYRIKQVDYNGEFDYSKVVVASCKNLNEDFIVYPTVTEGELTVQFGYFLNQFSYQLVNDLGEEVQAGVIVEENINQFVLDVGSLNSDLYYLKISAQLNSKTFKVVRK
jgi:hypothetical protein